MNSMLSQILKEIKTSNSNVGKFVREFRKNGPFSFLPNSNDAYASIAHYQKELFKLQESGKSLNELEDLFELPLSTHSIIREVQVKKCFVNLCCHLNNYVLMLCV